MIDPNLPDGWGELHVPKGMDIKPLTDADIQGFSDDDWDAIRKSQTIMKIQQIHGNRYLVQPDKPKEKAGEVIIPSTVADRMSAAVLYFDCTVKAVGDGDKMIVGVGIGDRLRIANGAKCDVEDGMRIVSTIDVLATLNDEASHGAVRKE